MRIENPSILFFADRLPPLIGGMEIHAGYFIEHFSKHPAFSLLATITKSPCQQDLLISENYNEIINLEKLPKLFTPNIIFFNSGRWIEVFKKLRLLFPKAFFIYRTGGNEIIQAPLEHINITNHRERQAYWASEINQTINILITNSAFTETRLRDIGITCSFLRCIGGVNVSAFKKKRPIEDIFHRKSLKLFCAARFVPYKNHHLLLYVTRELISRGYNIRLRLAGDGPMFAEIKKQARHWKLESSVIFLGSIDNEKVCQEIVSADLYIQFSSDYFTPVLGGGYIHSECMGRSILEALSAGTFVIASRSGALSEIITKDKGLLIDIDDPKAIADATETIIKKLPIKLPPIEAYSWENVFSQYESMMSRVLLQ